jgi:phosphoribosyl 1,2-cyclic phosphate phosphodiesterase
VRIEILGSGGAVATPRGTCRCAMCEGARAGSRDARMGPSVFVHGPDVLVDTPEESRLQLARTSITRIAAGVYSHWHPDHTAGRRVWEMNFDFRGWPPAAKETTCTPVYLPQQVARDFEEFQGIGDQFAYLESLRVVRRHEIPDGDSIEVGGTRITPFRLAEDYVYAFVFEQDGRRALVAMDELNGWTPPDDLGRFDVAVLPVGIFEHEPFTGERLIHEEHRLLQLEATYAETLEMVRALDAGRVVLSHVEHMDGVAHEMLVRLGERDGWEPAYDGMTIEVE